MSRTLQSVSSQQTPETEARMPLKVVWTLRKLWTTAHPHKNKNFFLSKNWSPSHSRSKLCVLAGPEPYGPEPVLLQVLSIYRPRVCARCLEKSPQLQHKGGREAPVWEVKTSCFSCVWTKPPAERISKIKLMLFFFLFGWFWTEKTSAVAVKSQSLRL